MGGFPIIKQINSVIGTNASGFTFATTIKFPSHLLRFLCILEMHAATPRFTKNATIFMEHEVFDNRGLFIFFVLFKKV